MVSRRISGSASTTFAYGSARFFAAFYDCTCASLFELGSAASQRDDLHDIRLGVRTAGAIDCPLSDLGEDNLHAENP